MLVKIASLKGTSLQSNDTVEEAKFPKANLTAFRLQALSGDNGGDSAAPSVTDAGDHEDPSSVLDVIGEIASGRVAKAEVGNNVHVILSVIDNTSM